MLKLMLKGKHIIITLLIIGLLWLNRFVYTTFKLLLNDKISSNDGKIGASMFIIVIEIIVLIGIIIWNWNKLWNWEFNLNKWICKLKH